MNGLSTALAGLLVFVMAWTWHDRGPHPRGTATWRSAPQWIRRSLRRDVGPIVLGSIVIEAWGLALLAAGSLVALNRVAADADRLVVLQMAWLVGALVVCATWFLIAVLSLWRR